MEERIAPATLTVTTVADSGAGSLRAAITSANADVAADTIIFNIAGSGQHVIALTSALPQITNPLVINGASEPGYADHPVIELDGTGTVGASGLTFSAGAVTVKALSVHGFDGNGIVVNNGTSGATIQGCFIGVDGTGTVADGNGQNGLLIQASNALIGGATVADRNVVAGNGLSGILVTNNASGTVIKGNYIGTNLLAALQIPNGGTGITLSGGSGHVIGGSAAGEGNVISGNGGDDVFIQNSNGNIVAGNIIGLDLPMKVELQSMADGIEIAGTSANNLIGGTAAGARNVIAAHDENSSAGIRLTTSGTGNTLLGNLIGTNPTGDDELGNIFGIVTSSPGTTIGDLSGHGNLVAGNMGYGIEGLGSTGLQILGNRVGIYTATGDLTLANEGAGVFLANVSNVAVKGNIVGGNHGDGVKLQGVSGAAIEANLFGTNALGTAARGNTAAGLAVIDSLNVTVGGADPIQGNLLSGNGTFGLYVSSGSPVSVFGNRFGTDAAGKGALGNTNAGVHVDGGAGHLIGGAAPGQGNLFSGNGRGIVISTDGTLVRGNIIGLDKDATTKLANIGALGGTGVVIDSGAGNIIGGSLAGEGNVIAGNAGSAVIINGTGTGNKVLGNLIGTNSAGAASLGNGGSNTGIHTVVVTAPGTTIGGPDGGRNIIDSGAGRAIHISEAANALVQNNWIGLAPNGTTALGNLAGIALSGAGTNNATIVDNVISGSTTWGLAATGNGGHTIAHNRFGTNATGTAIVANGQQGIILNKVTNTLIGGPKSTDGNVIAGSGIDAILLTGGTNMTMQNNLVGTNAAGTAALPNQEGISINSSTGNLVSNVSIIGNLIAGTNGSGINLSGAQTNTKVQSNSIGLAMNGVDALPNGQGISIGNGSGILIGGTAAQGNTVAFSQGAGIGIYFANSNDIQVLSNTLRQNVESGISFGNVNGPITIGGTTGNGNLITNNVGPGVIIEATKNVSMLGNTVSNNGGAGVQVQNASLGNTIGGAATGAANIITGNGGAGVAVSGGSGTLVTHNAIFGNTGLSIDLGATGATANDAGDADPGANGLQNKPVLSGAAIVPSGNTVVLGTLESAAGHAYRLEFFSGTNGSAQQFLFAKDVMTNTSGTAVFQVDIGAVPAGQSVIASATDLVTGDTSELGGVNTAAVTVPTLSIGDASVLETDTGSVNAVFIVTLSGVPTLPVSFSFSTQSGSAEAGKDFTATSGNGQFAAGTTTLTTTITVPVLGDDLAEFAEHFSVLIGNAQNVLVLDGTGDGKILNDDSNLVIDATHKLAKWRDLDGDFVTLKSSKPILSTDDFIFVADGNGGEQLAALLLADDGAAAARTSLTLSAKRDPLHPQSDGRANLGFLNAAGIDLGKVSISGDLARFEAGDLDLKTPGVASLTLGSAGFYGLTTQAPGGNLHLNVQGSVGAVKVRGDFAGAQFYASGKIGAVNIAGSLTGGAADFSGSIQAGGALASLTVGGSLSAGSGYYSGLVESGGAMGKVLVKGSVSDGAHLASGGKLAAVQIGGDLAGLDAAHRATISAVGSIGGVKIGGSVISAQVLAGYNNLGVAVNPDSAIGAVTVADNWIASDLVAGVDAGADGNFGTSDDHLSAAIAPSVNNFALVSKIAKIQIGGILAGTANDATDHFSFTAQRIGALSIGGLAFALDAKAADSLKLGLTNDLSLAELV